MVPLVSYSVLLSCQKSMLKFPHKELFSICENLHVVLNFSTTLVVRQTVNVAKDTSHLS